MFKKHNAKTPLKIKISFFLGLSSLLILAIILIVEQQTLNSAKLVMDIARETREKSLPEMSEDRRSLINIESLRRVAEVVYTTNDPQIRRTARINGQALAAESVLSKSEDFHIKTMRIVNAIGIIAKYKENIYNNENKLYELSRKYYTLLQTILSNIGSARQLKDMPVDLLTLPFDFLEETQIQISSETEVSALLNERNIQFEKITALCKKISSNNKEIKAACDDIAAVYKEQASAESAILQDRLSARKYWENTDRDLRSLRDSISNASQWASHDALVNIEQAATQTQRVLTLAGALLALFMIFFLLGINYYIGRPIRWIAEKLRSLQRGEGNNQLSHPSIKIKELAEVANLLEQFSTHISELYSRTTQLEEDSAEKHNLEEVMQAVFKASADGYLIWDSSEILFMSPSFMDLIGCSDPSEVSLDPEYFGINVKNLQKELDKGLLQSEMPSRSEITLINKSGDLIPCETTRIPITFNDKRMVLSYVRDLRQQKRIELDLRKAKEEAEEAAAAKSIFLARMSHELRTPMNGVLGLTHLALQKTPPPEQQQYLAKIESAARILLGIINDILDFSKIEQNKLTLEIAPLSLTSMLNTLTDLFLPQAQAKKLAFIIDRDRLIPDQLLGDYLRLSQVLLNLCGNAIKFTDQGEVILRLELVSEEGDYVTIRFIVVDTGVGLSAEQQQGLFQPFSQAHNYNTRKYGGTGLGLVISQRLVKLMGGEITLQSEPGVGSEFSFVITLQKSAEKPLEKPKLAASLQEFFLDNKRILLVEDNEINQEIAIGMLDSFGAKTTLAQNGEECLEILERETFDLILMDIQMPIMDGLTATELIRKEGRPEVRNIPIIAMTAHALQEDREKSFAAGMNEHINKPIDLKELREKLLLFLPLSKAKTKD